MRIKNKNQLIKNGPTKKVQKLRKDILDILSTAIDAVDPYNLVKDNLVLSKGVLKINQRKRINLSKYKNIYVVGAGKATFSMAKALETVLKRRIKKGFINVNEIPSDTLKYIKPIKASHPYPNKKGFKGAQKILNLAKKAKKDDLVFVLISGGGSALLPLPAQDITLEDLIKLNKLLVQSEAKIKEINIVRKHISAIKGGNLAKAIFPATAVCLYISDVVGNDLSFIASGPCVPDKSTFSQAIKVLKKHKLWQKTPARIKKYLIRGSKNKKLETPKPDNKIFKQGKFYNFILGENRVGLEAGYRLARKKRYFCQILTSQLEGEVHQIANKLLKVIRKKQKSRQKPLIITAGGETTLKLTGSGMGGRNQELAMIMSQYLPEETVFLSFNTDGIDGRTPFPVGGGICDQSTFIRAQEKGLKIEKFIKNNDSYRYLKELNELVITGKTGTNVGDIIIIGIV